MKKIFFFAATLISIAAAAQQSCVTARQVRTNNTDTTVTFTLTWSGCTTTNHLTNAWCFVDFRELNSNSWTRAIVSGYSAVGTGVSTNPGNSTGFYVKGTEGQSATVTVKLGNVSADKFNWCAFATDYPPQAVVDGNQSVTFKGTPPFTFTLSGNGGTSITEQRTGFRETPTQRVQTITDATGCTNTVSYTYSGCSAPTFNLGTVGFANATMSTITGTGANSHIHQLWSAPVTASNCNKTSFSSAAGRNDCRSGYSTACGHLFSWCLAAQYAATLCPSPWRVPTTEDIVALDLAIGGTGASRDRDQAAITKYFSSSVWGGLACAWWHDGGTALRPFYTTSTRIWVVSNAGVTTFSLGAMGSDPSPYYRVSITGASSGVTADYSYGLYLRCVRD